MKRNNIGFSNFDGNPNDQLTILKIDLDNKQASLNAALQKRSDLQAQALISTGARKSMIIALINAMAPVIADLQGNVNAAQSAYDSFKIQVAQYQQQQTANAYTNAYNNAYTQAISQLPQLLPSVTPVQSTNFINSTGGITIISLISLITIGFSIKLLIK